MTNDGSVLRHSSRWRKVGWVLIAVVALIAAAVAFLFTANHSYLKDYIETLVSDDLGREFSIGGALSIEVDESIEIRAGKIALAATAWSESSNLLEIDSVAIGVDLAAVVAGVLSINYVETSGIRVYAEENDNGENNWTFQQADVADESTEDSDISIHIARMQINNVLLEYLRPESEVFHVGIDHLGQRTTISGNVAVEIKGHINGTTFNGELDATDLDSLIELSDVELDLNGNIGEINFAASVGLQDALGTSRPSLHFLLAGPNAEYLTDVLEVPRVTTGVLDLEMNIEPTDDRMAVSVNGTFGEFEIDVRGFFDDLQKLQDAQLTAKAKGPNAAVIARLAGVDDFPAESFDVRAEFAVTGSALQIHNFRANIGATKLEANANLVELPKLAGATATLRFETPEISHFDAVTGLEGQLTGRMTIHADLAASEVTATKVLATVQAMAGEIIIDGVLQDSLVGSQFDLELKFDDSSELFGALGIVAPQPRPLRAEATVLRRQNATAIEDGAVTYGNDKIQFSALVDDLLQAGESELKIGLRAVDLQDLLGGLGLVDAHAIPQEPLDLSGEFLMSAGDLTLKGVTATLAENELNISGTIRQGNDGATLSLDVNAFGPNLKNLLPASDAVASQDKPYRIKAKLVSDGKRLSFSNIDAQLDDSKLTGALTVGLEPIAESLSVDLVASSPNLVELLPPNEDLDVLQNVPLAANIRVALANGTWTAESVTIDVGDADITLRGTVGAWPELADTELDVALSAPDVSALGSLAGVLLPAEAANVDFHIVSVENGVNLERFEIKLGDSDIAGDIRYTNAEVPTLDINIHSQYLDVTHFLSEESTPTQDDGGIAASTSERVIPDTPIPYQNLARLNSNFSFRIDELKSGPRHLADVVLVGSLKDGALLVEDASLVASRGGKINGRMGVRPLAVGAEFWIRLFGENIDAGLPAETEEELANLPRYDLTLALVTTGSSVREVAAAANGYLKFSGGPGQVRVGMMRAFTQDFMAELLDTVNPFVENNPYSNLKCSVILAAVENGQFHGDPVLVAQTDKLKIVARTSIDLATEIIDADINTVAQKGLGISLGDLVNPYVKIGGTLAAPSLQLDAQEALFQTSVAVATGGFSVLAKSMKGRYLETGDPCIKATEEAEERFAELEERYGNARPR